MTVALWALAGAVILLAAAIIGCFLAWQAGAGNRLDVLTEEDIADRLGPVVAWSRRNGYPDHETETDDNYSA